MVRLGRGAWFEVPRPVRACSSSMRLEASALLSVSSNSSPASWESVCRDEACAPVIRSSPVTQSSGSFSVLSMPGEYPIERAFGQTLPYSVRDQTVCSVSTTVSESTGASGAKLR